MNPLNYSPAAQAKAILAGIIAALTYLAAQDLSDLGALIADDWLEAVLAFLIAYAAVFGVPNRNGD